jgi:hypothetical protein
MLETSKNSSPQRASSKAKKPAIRDVDEVNLMTRANAALVPQVASEAAFADKELRKAAFYADDDILILNMDVREAMGHLARAGVVVNCIVTSPPFYGQRDLLPVSIHETDLRPSRREEFWFIVAARSEDETEVRAGQSAGRASAEGYPASDASAVFG